MNLQTVIRPELWGAVKDTYEAEKYRHAIMDAMAYLTDVLRTCSNLDGDGRELVGKALEGKSPVLRLNKLQTESERDEQYGFAQILRGLYAGVRNPRHHEQWTDTKETADALIHFINHLLEVIGKSEESYTVSGFLDTVFDPFFVKSQEYADGLVGEIPPSRRLDTVIQLFRERNRGVDKASLISLRALPHLKEEELAQLASVVSGEFRSMMDDTEMGTALAFLPGDFWPRIDGLARQRIENAVISSLREGRVQMVQGVPRAVHNARLGPAARAHLTHFSAESRYRVEGALVTLLRSSEWHVRTYAIKYFLAVFPQVITSSAAITASASAISTSINDDETIAAEMLTAHLDEFSAIWCRQFAAEIDSSKIPVGCGYIYEPDGTPILVADDIPF